MGKAIRTCALVLLLACSASAGIMQFDKTQPPPPSTQSVEETPAEDQDTATAVETETLLVQVALDVLALL